MCINITDGFISKKVHIQTNMTLTLHLQIPTFIQFIYMPPMIISDIFVQTPLIFLKISIHRQANGQSETKLPAAPLGREIKYFVTVYMKLQPSSPEFMFIAT